MTINGLLEYWADWCLGRFDSSGRCSSKLNALMASGVLLSGSSNAFSQIPYGIDGDAVAMTVDRYVSRLSPVPAAVVRVEFLTVGNQLEKAANVSQQCGAVVSHQNYRVTLHRIIKKLEANPEIAFLLRKLS